jgi:predicted Zn-dependent protease
LPIFYLLLPLLLLFASYSGASPLPDLSSSATSVLSTEQQNQLGESLYLELQKSGQVNRDPVVNHYINGLAQRLLAAAPYAPHTFTFFVIDNPQINAFAMFGGYIGIYSGLIRASRSESELASVIAHEIAHVTQDHLRRAIEKSNSTGIPVTVALLAAILLGQDAPELAEAAVTAVIAGQQQHQLNYTRDHEQEADRLGIERLSHAQFDPQSMARFFSLVQERSRYNSAYPEFLRTHPVTTQRISEAQDRARSLPEFKDESSIEFIAIQARLALSDSNDTEQLIRENSSRFDTQSRYILALALHEMQRHTEALDIIRQLELESPNVLPFKLTEAKILQALNKMPQARQIYQNILDISPRNRLATMALTDLYLLQNRPREAEELLLKLGQQVRLQAADYRFLAKIANTLNQASKSYLYLAEALIMERQYKLALKELRQAQKHASDSFYINNRLDARIDEVQEKIKSQDIQR